MDIQFFFSEAVRLSASDIHLIVGYAPMIRVAGKLQAVEGTSTLTSEALEGLVFQVFSDAQKEQFLTNKEIDFSVAAQGGRFRTNVYYQRGSIAADFRLIPTTIRTIDQLGLPSICHDFCKLRQGFVLVTGPTGHGKSTTLAAMVNKINETQSHHIITIEDPIEYIYPKSLPILS